MCRACYAVVVAPADRQAALRRAAGLEVQVLAMLDDPGAELPDDPTPDVVIVDAGVSPAAPIEGPAIVWVGDDAPTWADVSVANDASLGDALPGAIVRALVARRQR